MRWYRPWKFETYEFTSRLTKELSGPWTASPFRWRKVRRWALSGSPGAERASSAIHPENRTSSREIVDGEILLRVGDDKGSTISWISPNSLPTVVRPGTFGVVTSP